MLKHRVVLTGGGTGGHIYPALAVAEQFRDDSEVEAILYIGARAHMEEKLAAERQLDFVGLEVSGLPRRFSGKLLSWPFQFIAAVFDARRALLDFQPSVVLGTGGYASAPALVAASMLGIPYAIHEPDAHPGLVNRCLARGASLVSCGMQGAHSRLKPNRGRIVVNGNPVGKSFVNPMRRDAACAILGLRSDLKTLLITGGSQGAKAINEAVLGALPALLEMDPPIQIIHQVGSKNLYECKERLDPLVLSNTRYFLRDYFDDLSVAYASSDLAICRAGAMTVSELSVTGTPALFIPYPYAAADHQTHNARYMAEKGAAIMMPQTGLSAASLLKELKAILSDDERLRTMRKAMIAEGKGQASRDLASQLKELSTAFQIRQNKERLRAES
ncbi:MAG: undecaprenyldiphospho-muramoylpentapeptide beta-N-acetylglucosaminyltransferase [Candidatus Obscuribacterales bacterium]|nr:undecaprenyldiphospho-muramoylpentapeptide beta-N-acetylglucosaminyltransferase [Candidatus Obscuribacterales bacterium]